MKFLDRVLRDWRIQKCIPFVRANDKILDIGCFDGHLFEKLKFKSIQNSIGLDPLLTEIVEKDNYTLIPGVFPDDLPENQRFDCIILLAVLEHIPRETQKQISADFYHVLEKNGRVIITVPSPFVDRILWLLSKLHLIDGMSLDEHYGFKVEEIPQLFESNKYKLIKHKRFQLGLNNLFVFEKLI
jgi:2-polyprenyl-3-methyl-5-hydroxy-6-metoxy-1,4-benzoquinol methylase